MQDLKSNVAKNLTDLRKSRHLTQSELAEKFDYSDKAVSKWENAETLPGVDTLQQLADFYGVSLDYLTHEPDANEQKQFQKKNSNSVNKTVITALAVSLVWLLAIVVAIGTQILAQNIFWRAFVWAVPASILIALIFNAIWGKRKWSPALITFFGWTLLAAVYIELGFDLPETQGWRLWMLFLLGIPITIAAILFSHLKNEKSAE
jgi:transcriptional regulator with XRE-family HTH domain